MSDNRPQQPAQAPIDETLLRQLEAAQQQIEYIRQQLTDSQRLATIGTIAAVIAHEFNNLLTPIVSYSQFALDSANGDDPDMELIKKALSKAYQASSKAGRICTSMLGLAMSTMVPPALPVSRACPDGRSRSPTTRTCSKRLETTP